MYQVHLQTITLPGTAVRCTVQVSDRYTTTQLHTILFVEKHAPTAPATVRAGQYVNFIFG